MLSTAIYEKLTPEFSYSVGGQVRSDKIAKKHLTLLEESLELKPGFYFEILAETIDKVNENYLSLAKQVKTDYPKCKITVRLTALIRKRIKHFSEQVR